MNQRKLKPRMGKTRSKQTSHTCPYCHTAYRHKSMATHCLKTQHCRTYNAPSAKRLKALVLQVGVGSMVQFLTELLSKQKESTQALTAKLQSGLDRLFQEIGKLQCNERYVAETCSKVADTLVALWPPSEDTDAIHMLSVAGALTIELRQNLKAFWAEYPNLDSSACWLSIEEILDKIFEVFNGDLSEDYIYADKVPVAVEQLRAVIWPGEETKRVSELRLYLINDTYWVAAPDKNRAKEIVQEHYGCVIITVEGIQLSEVFEGGQTAKELLDSAQGKAGILATT